MRIGGDPVNLSNGLLNLTNWLGNVIMPTMAGLFAAAAIYRYSKGHPYQHLSYAALASLMCPGLLRVMESFSNQAAWNNPDRYWISILTLVNWVGNVLLPRRETRRDQERAPAQVPFHVLDAPPAVRLRYRQRPGTCRPQVDQNHPAL